MIVGRELVTPHPASPGDQITVPGTVEYVKISRDWLRAGLESFGIATETVENARVVITELVTNAALHTESDVLRLRWYPCDGGLCVEVWDDGARPPIMGDLDDPAAESGRGLAILDLITRSWNWQPRADGGKVVWALC